MEFRRVLFRSAITSTSTPPIIPRARFAASSPPGADAARFGTARSNRAGSVLRDRRAQKRKRGRNTRKRGRQDRKSVVWGKRVSGRVDLGGRGVTNKNKYKKNFNCVHFQ